MVALHGSCSVMVALYGRCGACLVWQVRMWRLPRMAGADVAAVRSDAADAAEQRERPPIRGRSGDHVVAGSHQPSAISHQPSVISHQSSVISHQSSVISHRSSVISHQSSVVGHWSSVIGHPSPVTSHQSPVTSHRSPVTSHPTFATLWLPNMSPDTPARYHTTRLTRAVHTC